MALPTFTYGDYLVTIFTNIVKEKLAHFRANDKTKTSYSTIPRTVTYNGKTYRVTVASDEDEPTGAMFDGCFQNCVNMTSAPALPSGIESLQNTFNGCTALVNPPSIPSTVTLMGDAFYGCSALTSAPVLPAGLDDLSCAFAYCSTLTSPPAIPSNVEDMSLCFYRCAALETAPIIPASVRFLGSCFLGCQKLSGEVKINANSSSARFMFKNTVKGIWLTGSSAYLQEYASTATNGNVFVGAIPLSYSLAAERVTSDGGTAPAAEGSWLHLVLNTSWSNFAANSLDAIALQDNGSSVTPIWYTDAAKTSAITLPGWKPSATTEVHAWVPANLTRHVLSLTVSDAYHTGSEISLVVPASFRTMDILAGGRGIAFGQVAENEGFECAMRASFSDNAGLMTALLDLIYPVGKYVWTSDADWDPNDIIGGTWELIPEGQALISAGTTYLAEQTYGANAKRIADANIAHGHGFTQPSVTGGGGDATGNMSANSSHSHTVGYVNYKRASTTAATTAVSYAESSSNKSTSSESVQHTHKLPAHTHTVSGGSVSNLGTPSARTDFNVMQASQAAYCWHRTA